MKLGIEWNQIVVLKLALKCVFTWFQSFPVTATTGNSFMSNASGANYLTSSFELKNKLKVNFYFLLSISLFCVDQYEMVLP